MTYKLPLSTSTLTTDADHICSDRQRLPDLARALVATVGDSVTLRYQENGHVTLPAVNPGKNGSGLVFVYGTWIPDESHKFRHIHNVWQPLQDNRTQEGFLLARTPFDDGKCYQVNNGSISQQRQLAFPHAVLPPEGENLWCTANITVPSPYLQEPTRRQYSTCRPLALYWVWQWPGSATNTSREQYYTTCMDVIVRGI
jgi:hypothetical protein